jgi:hypothetical protein
VQEEGKQRAKAMLNRDLKLLEVKYELLTELYLRIVELNTRAFFPGMRMGDYCEMLIIVKTILNRQVRHRSTSLSALARSMEIARTTLYRRLVRLVELGVVEQHGMMYVLPPESLDTAGAIDTVERIAAVVHETAKKLTNLERSTTNLSTLERSTLRH